MKTFEKFEALNIHKKKMIINASMKEFIRGGYDKASVNRIVETANISKGSLFYYFDNKKLLYLYLFEICERMILETAEEGINEADKDFISRLTCNVKGNIDLLREYPLIYAFMKSCKSEESEKVKDGIELLKEKTANECFAKLYKDIDYSLFREDLDQALSIYTIKTTLFQLVHDSLSRNDIGNEALIIEIDKVALFFRTTFYK